MTGPSALRYGEYYHIYSCGNDKHDIFAEDRNYPHFLRLYARHMDPVANACAHCLLRNHIHLLMHISHEPQLPSGATVAKRHLIPD